ncbi:hypothetical protein ES332_A10G021800v1 [Gossypium tomentosum]|uniref:Uncharacterized protein n=1 Tax=Gossypium tomentosum TaxID=34277 RepID=A0A5D2NN13_GOSTO|nr:hypothetical protein ES332_A10G021800v1 [Gossypium tomentosum]
MHLSIANHFFSRFFFEKNCCLINTETIFGNKNGTPTCCSCFGFDFSRRRRFYRRLIRRVVALQVHQLELLRLVVLLVRPLLLRLPIQVLAMVSLLMTHKMIVYEMSINH